MNFRKELNLLLASIRVEIMDRLTASWAFIFVMLGVVIRFAVTVIFFQALYTRVPLIGGWDFRQTLVLLGTYNIISIVSWATYVRGLGRLSRLIEYGDLDFFLLKPVNLKRFLSYRYIDALFSLPELAVGIGLVIYGSFGQAVWLNIPAYLFFLAVAFVLHFSVVLFFTTINFYRLLHQDIWLADELFKLGRYPIAIYRGGVKLLLSILVPVAFIYSFPTRILFGQVELVECLVPLGLAVAFYLLSHLFWTRGLDRYESARG
jgi:ABC-2 type transport system permease protein